MTPKQRVLKKWPTAFCYRLAPRGMYAVIVPLTRKGNEIFCTHTSHVEAWKEAARRMKL